MKYCVTYSADEVLQCVNSIDVEAETPEQAEQKVVRELQEEAIPEGKSGEVEWYGVILESIGIESVEAIAG